MKKHLVPYDGDVLRDIGHIPFSDFWKKCEELLPEDWAMQLIAKPHLGFLVYGMFAFLDEEDAHIGMTSGWCSTPERAVERLFYGLRDGIVSDTAVEFSRLPPAVREGDRLSQERTT